MTLIQDNKSILVVGSPRSGTSLCMRTLETLGVPVKFGMPKSGRTQLAVEKNPGGYYEGPWTGLGLSNPKAKLGGHAIKVLGNAAMPPRTDYDLVHAVILCSRCPKDQLDSIANLRYPMRRMPAMWLQQYATYAAWLVESDVPHVVVDYNDWADGSAVDKLVAFLGYGQANAGQAKSLFDSNLRRYADSEPWTDKEIVAGTQCDMFYAALHADDKVTMRSIANDQQQAVALNKDKAKTHWVDVDPAIQGLTHVNLFHGTWSKTNCEQQLLFNRRPDQRAKLIELHDQGMKYGQNNCKCFAVSDQVDEIEIFNGDYKLPVLMPRVACSHCDTTVSMADCFTCWHGRSRFGHTPSIKQSLGEAAQ